jgi:hemerythrin-like domain-containing protein
MTEIIDVLRQEHSNIDKVLGILERELNLFGRSERPDYEVLFAVIEYFKDYPDSCHHPKEDMVFAKLRERDPVAAATVGDLEAEHREEANRLRRVALAIESVLNDQDLLRQDVDNIIRDFIAHEREHMAMEEDVLFPAALAALQPVDWADLALKMADRYDPLSRPGLEEKYEVLLRKILLLEAEAEAERVH